MFQRRIPKTQTAPAQRRRNPCLGQQARSPPSHTHLRARHPNCNPPYPAGMQQIALGMAVSGCRAGCSGKFWRLHTAGRYTAADAITRPSKSLLRITGHNEKWFWRGISTQEQVSLDRPAEKLWESHDPTRAIAPAGYDTWHAIYRSRLFMSPTPPSKWLRKSAGHASPGLAFAVGQGLGDPEIRQNAGPSITRRTDHQAVPAQEPGGILQPGRHGILPATAADCWQPIE